MSILFHSLRILLVMVTALATSSCGFYLRGSYNLPDEIQKLSVTSFDKYGILTRKIKRQLLFHGIDIVPPAEGVANLHLNSESYRESTLSLYQNMRIAEKQFNYSVSYTVMVPKKSNYTFSITLSRTYLDNPLSALAKSVEIDMLSQEMRIEAAKQIMRQLTRLNAYIEDFERTEIKEKNLRKLYQGIADDKTVRTIETHLYNKTKVLEGNSFSSHTVPQADTDGKNIITESDITP
ncbi:LPS-assembly lipoprotein LptE [Candidatus Enterovibrio escicola]|uniref:LPS-assembly lipoprotein LptE n=2 Tax=Candidatus Enterovibrio escicola TaxID=1927127 RepID=UPI00123811AA|nr:LPS assembly lipoprotein LptE [Candidatus Enterovibrio escacola]